MIRNVILFFLLTLGVKTINAQEAQISLLDEISYVYIEKLIAIAKENYPQVKVHNSHIEIGETAIKNAKIGWLSPLSLSYVYSPTTTINLENPTFFSGYQIGFNFNLGSMLQTPGNIKRTKEELNINKFERDIYLLELTTEVKTRYFNYLKSVKILKVISQNYLDTQNSLTMIRYKYEKGESTLDELSDVSTRYANLVQSKLESEVNLLVTKASLEELLGIKLEAIPN